MTDLGNDPDGDLEGYDGYVGPPLPRGQSGPGDTISYALDAREDLVTAYREIAEYHQLTMRQAALLTGVASALKGPPPPLVMWDHSQLPFIAAEKMAVLSQVRDILLELQAQVVDQIPGASWLPSIDAALGLIEGVLAK